MSTVKILIIEDDPLQAQEMAVFVRNAGHKVVGMASNGEQAIGLGETHQPELLLCDVVLPGEIDGIQAAAIIRQSLRIPVVFLTNDRDPLTQQRIKRSGETYLPKPFTESQLVDAMMYALLDSESENLTPRKVLEMNGFYYFHEYKTSRHRKVGINDILYIKSDKHQVKFYMKGGVSFNSSIGISELSAVFREPQVVQVHRTYMVNVLNVESLTKEFLFLTGCPSIPIGEKYLPNLERVFTIVKG